MKYKSIEDNFSAVYSSAKGLEKFLKKIELNRHEICPEKDKLPIGDNGIEELNTYEEKAKRRLIQLNCENTFRSFSSELEELLRKYNLEMYSGRLRPQDEDDIIIEDEEIGIRGYLCCY